MPISFGITGSSPLRCTLYHGGSPVYDIYTSAYTESTTAITRDGVVVATINWRGSRIDSKFTYGGQTAPLKTLMPRAGAFSRSRIYMAKDGMRLKWKKTEGLVCVGLDTGFNLAHHNGVAISPFEAKLSKLEIFDQGLDVQDELVATWVIMDVLVHGRNPINDDKQATNRGRRPTGGGGYGGYDGAGSGGSGDGGCGGGDGGCGGSRE